ncbi:hypothetical protein D920_01231 [Enterococcus faecalis 13-SD-W-01]|nr:hypothetical protein D920_01231 [Enterococcus faecalis 13-SD-W-01]
MLKIENRKGLEIHFKKTAYLIISYISFDFVVDLSMFISVFLVFLF